MRDVIQSLWIGPQLSEMERLAILSFLRNGHEFHLYVYEHTAGIPPGAAVLDGNEILPARRIFTYRDHPSPAGFANFFRYKLLLEKGGWFVDTDTICLRPFDFAADYVFSSQGIADRRQVNLAAIKVPPRSAVMKFAWKSCKRMNPRQLQWGQCGPDLMTKAVEKYSLQEFVQLPEVFCPIDYLQWEKVLDPRHEAFRPQTYAVHLWNEMWRRAGKDKNKPYHPFCLFERLKQQYILNAIPA